MSHSWLGPEAPAIPPKHRKSEEDQLKPTHPEQEAEEPPAPTDGSHANHNELPAAKRGIHFHWGLLPGMIPPGPTISRILLRALRGQELKQTRKLLARTEGATQSPPGHTAWTWAWKWGQPGGSFALVGKGKAGKYAPLHVSLAPPPQTHTIPTLACDWVLHVKSL